MGDAIRYVTVLGSLVGVLALTVMMSTQWRLLSGSAQRLRYWSLLCYAVSFTYGGAESLIHNTPFGPRHVMALFTTIFALVAIWYTYRDVRREKRNED